MGDISPASSSRQPSAERSGTSTPVLSQPTAAMNKAPEEGSRLRTFLSILKKFIGVPDMAAQRFSLPAQLLEPVPNLEYWHYLDRPEAFASIGDSDEPLGRMLGALRFWFTKDLKYVKGKPCKPYNSVLGEFFRCNWDVEETLPPVIGSKPANSDSKNIRITYFTEQTSHHPPVSAFWIECPEKGISARGYDQLSANFTGTRIRVSPGNYNQGIFITLKNVNETYRLTHPTAHLGGLLKGTLSVSVSDHCYVTCPETGLKAILNYIEEGWLGKAQNKMVGIIFKYDPNNDDKLRLRDVPDSDVLARVEGSWHEQIYFSIGSAPMASAEKKIVIDLVPLWPKAKLVPPEDSLLPNESGKMWTSVTNAILAKQYNEATAAKQEIEERQRQKAADRKARNVEWQPRFFTGAVTPPGKPELTEDGRDAIDRMHNNDFTLKPNVETAA